MRKIILGILLLVLATNVAGAATLNYDIEEDLSKVWVKGDLSAGTTTVYVTMDEMGYAPSPTGVYDYFHTFDNMVGLTDLSTNSAYAEAVGGELVLHNDGTRRALVKINTPVATDDYILEIRGKKGENVELVMDWDGTSQDTTYYGASNRAYFYYVSWSTPHRFIMSSDNEEGSSNIELDTSYHTYKFIRDGSSLKAHYDGILKVSGSSVVDYGDYIGLQCRERMGSGGGGIGATYDWIRVRKLATTEPTVEVIDMVDYFEIRITSAEAMSGYQVSFPGNLIGVNSTTQSLHFTNTVPGSDTPDSGDTDGEYVPTIGDQYAQFIDTIFPSIDTPTAWVMLSNIITSWTVLVGEDIFWLFVLPLPIMAYWIKTKSVELPTVVYLVLGGVFYGVAPDVMQTPARIMLMFGITGMLYHFFKNRG